MENYNSGQNYTTNLGPSVFKGNIFGYIGRKIIGTLLTIFTLGIAYPWSVVLIKRWEINNTYIDGRRLEFSGTAMGLFGNYILWWFLTIITLGIYSFWLHIKMRQWIIKHTHFA